jgi:hypothetical protein
MRYITGLAGVLLGTMAWGQGTTQRALFLGNSYTGVNNLPQMVADAAASAGDNLVFDSNTPGGQTLQAHSTNATSLAKIALGNWDYVVLQEQSQLPSFPLGQVQTDVFPYAQLLNGLILEANPCAETVFYMTWGRENGDAGNCASWPPVCTYNGMDSLLNLRYRMMAEDNDAMLSPVGAVWHYIRENHPTIDLYQADESHPSVAGTYAAACCFYAALFRKDPTAITYTAGLPAADAAIIRASAKWVVFDNLLEWNIGAFDPVAEFTAAPANGNQVAFFNASAYATDFLWNFGDGATSQEMSPLHDYAAPGSYVVELIASQCGRSDTSVATIDAAMSVDIAPPASPPSSTSSSSFSIYPNPAQDVLHVQPTGSPHAAHRWTYALLGPTGQVIRSGTWGASDSPWDVSALPPGIYVVQWSADGEPQSPQRFVKTGGLR